METEEEKKAVLDKENSEEQKEEKTKQAGEKKEEQELTRTENKVKQERALKAEKEVEANKVRTAKTEHAKLKKVRNVILIILFNIVYPYLLYLISNLTNGEYFVTRAIRSVTNVYNFFFLYEAAIIYGLYFLFKAIFRKSLRSNIALAVVLNLISLISFYKIQAVAKPFWPEDILLIGNAVEIAGYGNLHFEANVVMQLLATIIFLVIQWLITKYTEYEGKQKIISRVVIGIIGISLLSFVCFYDRSDIKGFDEGNYNSQVNYNIYGATVEFFRNVYKLVEKPTLDFYSEERLEAIKQESESLAELNQQEVEQAEKPNIIAIMVESFTDITQIDALEFEKDPLPTYRSILANYPHGNTVVSIYGGETSMSEFEFLTGSSTRFLDGKRYPYAQVIKDETPSIVSTLKEQGYTTTAIHANDGAFYNRDTAYSYLGFDNMVFKDDMEDIDNVYDTNVSDMDTAEEIVKQYEEMGDTQKFIFAITIELHSPLNDTRYAKYDIPIKPKTDISTTELLAVQVYSQGLYHFDQSLNYLIDYFEQQEEKVMLVFYGDHKPAFNTIYSEAYGEGIEKYQTPYVIWTNYELEQEEIAKYSKDKVSIAGLAMMVLEEANIEFPWYYTYIQHFYEQYPVCTNRFLIDKEGNELDINTTNELIENYNIVLFELLYN